jgi:transposase
MKVYSEEFKADVVALYVSDPTRTYASVAKDLGVNRETLRLWVKQAGRPGWRVTRGPGPVAGGRCWPGSLRGRA